jgi:hypothetical protein
MSPVIGETTLDLIRKIAPTWIINPPTHNTFRRIPPTAVGMRGDAQTEKYWFGGDQMLAIRGTTFPVTDQLRALGSIGRLVTSPS